MADNVRTAPLRIRPSEYRSILLMGDFAMAIASVFAALAYVETIQFLCGSSGLYLAKGVAPGLGQCNRLDYLPTIFEPQFWFYLLPIVWVLLLDRVI